LKTSDWLVARRALAELALDSVPSQSVSLQFAAGRVLAQPVRGPAGAELCAAGTLLGPAHLVVLARAGIDRVEARPRPRVAAAAWPGAGASAALFCAWARAMGAVMAECGLLAGKVAGDPAPPARGADLTVLLGAPGVDGGEWDFLHEVALEPGGRCVVRRAPGGALAMELPGDPEGLLVAFHVLAVPLLRRLRGESPAVEPATALLRYSKVQVHREGRWYPGRFVSDPGGAAVAHMTWAPPDPARIDCLFLVPGGLWLRDGDPVQWLPLVGQA